jgi:hypothetical protein
MLKQLLFCRGFYKVREHAACPRARGIYNLRDKSSGSGGLIMRKPKSFLDDRGHKLDEGKEHNGKGTKSSSVGRVSLLSRGVGLALGNVNGFPYTRQPRL